MFCKNLIILTNNLCLGLGYIGTLSTEVMLRLSQETRFGLVFLFNGISIFVGKKQDIE